MMKLLKDHSEFSPFVEACAQHDWWIGLSHVCKKHKKRLMVRAINTRLAVISDQLGGPGDVILTSLRIYCVFDEMRSVDQCINSTN